MPTKSATATDITKLRGQFNAFGHVNPLIADVHKLRDQLTGRDYRHSQNPSDSQWLVSQNIDLLFVCGLLPWILGAIAYFSTGGLVQQPVVGTNQQLLTMFLVFSSFLIGESHQFTSILRYYSKTFRRRRNLYRWHRLPIWFLYAVAALGLVAFLGATSLSATPLGEVSKFIVNVAGLPIAISAGVLVILFPAVLMQHFSAQAKAVGLIYCSRNNFYLSDLEKLALSAVAWLLVITGVQTIAAPFVVAGVFSDGNMFASLRPIVNFFVNSSADALAATVVLTRTSVVFLGLHFILRGIQRKDWLPIGAALTWLNMASFTLIPTDFMLYVWLFVPVFFHASQHWAIAWNTQQRELKQNRIKQECFAVDGNVELRKFCSDFRRLVVPAQILSAVLLFGMLILGHLFGFAKGLPGLEMTLSAVFSIGVFYCHYFTDRIVWRPTN